MPGNGAIVFHHIIKEISRNYTILLHNFIREISADRHRIGDAQPRHLTRKNPVKGAERCTMPRGPKAAEILFSVGKHDERCGRPTLRLRGHRTRPIFRFAGMRKSGEGPE